MAHPLRKTNPDRQPVRRALHLTVVSVLCELLAAAVLCAQPPADTARPVPTPPPDTLAPRADSTVRPLALPQRWVLPHGAMLGREEPGVIDKRAIVRSRYHTLYDILVPVLPAQRLSNGTPGARRELTIAGADPATLPIQFDGRPLSMPAEAPWLLEWYPTEYLDRAEVVDGARAFLLGGGRSLRLLNLVHPRFDVQGSYARAAYAQGENNTTVGDITYARNIGSEVALTAGFRRISSDGSLPGRNSNASLWNARFGATWYPSEKLSIALSELYTDASYGNNGGLVPTSSRVAALADVVNDTLVERTVRHDVTLSARLLLATPPGDSAVAGRGETMRLEGMVYYTSNDPRLEVGGRLADGQEGRDLLPEDIVGLRAAAVLPLAPSLSDGSVPVFTHLLADAHASAAGLTLEGSGLVGFALGDAVALRGGALLRLDNAAFGFGLAGDVALRVGGAELAGSLALPLALAADPPPSRADTVSIESEVTRLLGEARAGWKGEGWRVEAGGIVRLVERSSGRVTTVVAPNATVELPLPWNLAVRFRAVGTIDPDRKNVLPLVSGTGDLFGTWQLYGGNLDLQLGTTLEGRSAAQLWELDPARGDLFTVTSPARDAVQPFPLWSVWAVGRIGSAFIRVEWRNLLDVEYTTIYRHPEFRREILFGFNWAFID